MPTCSLIPSRPTASYTLSFYGAIELEVAWPYPEVVDGYALPLEGPGLGIEANEALVDEALADSKPFVPSLQPRLNGLDGSVRNF